MICVYACLRLIFNVAIELWVDNEAGGRQGAERRGEERGVEEG